MARSAWHRSNPSTLISRLNADRAMHCMARFVFATGLLFLSQSGSFATVCRCVASHGWRGRADISGCQGAVHGSPFLTSAILDCHAAGLGDLAAQVATKRLNGSRVATFFRCLLRSNTQRVGRPSDGRGDTEAGGRTAMACGEELGAGGRCCFAVSRTRRTRRRINLMRGHPLRCHPTNQTSTELVSCRSVRGILRTVSVVSR